MKFAANQEGYAWKADTVAAHLSLTELLAREKLLTRQLFKSAPGSIVILDNHDKVVDANPAFLRLFQYQFEDVRGRTLNELIVPPGLHDEATELSRWALRLGRDERFEREVVRRRKDGSLVEARVLATPIKIGDKQVGLYVIYVDITALREAERSLAHEKEVAEVTLHAINDAVIRTDAVGTAEYMNPVAERLTGWSLAEAHGKALSEVFDIMNKRSRSRAPDPVARCLTEGLSTDLTEHTVLLRHGGGELGIEGSAAPLLSRAGRIIGAVLVFRDVTERRRLRKEIAFRATHDPLTGAYNRPALEVMIGRRLADRRRQNRSHAFLYLDLDNFKYVNDAYGHETGDAVLREMAARIKAKLRRRDMLARLGGDEFGVLLRDCDQTAAQSIAGSILAALHDKPLEQDGQPIRIAGSIGIVMLRPDVRTRQQLLREADEASYVAKEEGGNCYSVYQHTIGQD